MHLGNLDEMGKVLERHKLPLLFNIVPKIIPRAIGGKNGIPSGKEEVKLLGFSFR